ncbi:hypothetical protein Tco_0037826, partial [Tanacetum coccineum]
MDAEDEMPREDEKGNGGSNLYLFQLIQAFVKIAALNDILNVQIQLCLMNVRLIHGLRKDRVLQPWRRKL